MERYLENTLIKDLSIQAVLGYEDIDLIKKKEKPMAKLPITITNGKKRETLK